MTNVKGLALGLLAAAGLPWAASGSIFHREEGKNSTCIPSSFLTWTGQSPCLITSCLQVGTIFTASCIEKSWRTILNPRALEVPWIGVVLNALSRQSGCPGSVIQAAVHPVPLQDNGVPEEKKKEGRKWRNSECKMNVKRYPAAAHSDTWLFSAEQGTGGQKSVSNPPLGSCFFPYKMTACRSRYVEEHIADRSHLFIFPRSTSF